MESASKETAMSQQMGLEIPSSVRDLASKSADQAREAYDRFIESTRQAQDVVAKSTDVIATGARDISERAVEYTEHNLQAHLEFAQRLVPPIAAKPGADSKCR